MTKRRVVHQDPSACQVEVNANTGPTLNELAELRVTRRQVLGGGAASAVGALFGSLGLAGCVEPPRDEDLKLGFTAVPKSLADLVTVPPGYTARVLFSWGDPLFTGGTLPARISDLTLAQQEAAAGDHHDGIYYFGLDNASTAVPGVPSLRNNDRGMLCVNHEAITEDFAHPRGPSFNNLTAANQLQNTSARTDQTECLKEMALHGVSVIEVRKDANGRFQYVQGSPFNRRVTTRTPVQINGPVRGSTLVQTKFSPTGTMARGTLNNCGCGFTPWGTYITCEENFIGYFGHSGTISAEQARYGAALHGFQNLRWYTAPDNAAEELSRFQLNSPANATGYGNEANTFGYAVEIDPYDPTTPVKKRTALGRMAMEVAWPRFRIGQKIAFYIGDDNSSDRSDYMYKFVTDAVFTGTEARVNDILDSGTLFVARFNADGTGTWLPLTVAALAAAGAGAAFPTQADICVKTRLAGDAVGATRLDRPEWTAVSHDTGEIYLTMTNNSNRRPVGATVTGSQRVTDASSPRAYTDMRAAVPPFISASTTNGNVNGQIIRFRETNDDASATTFTWDIYLFGAQSDANPANVNLSMLTSDQDFSSPDGLWFGRPGNPGSRILWIQTDDGAYTDVTNNQMLAALPGRVGDGATVTISNTVGAVTGTQTTPIGAAPNANNLRRFLVGPRGCEITGIDSTPDNKVLFLNIQHPGELGGFDNFNQATNVFSQQSAFNTIPGDIRARSATIVVTKDDGGIVGL